MNSPEPEPDLGPAPPTVDDKRWAQRARALQFTQLADLRATAERWRNALAGLTSLLGVVSAVAAPEIVDRLSATSRLAVGLLAGAGLLALLVGLYKAMGAAFGVPGEQIRATAGQLRAWEAEQTVKAVAALSVARVATFGGIALLLASAGYVYATVQDKQAPMVEVTTSSIAYCGTLQTGGTGQIRIVGRDGVVHTVALSEVRTIASGAEC